MAIKPPSGAQPPLTSNPIEGSIKGQATGSPSVGEPAFHISPEAVAQAIKDYKKLRDKLKQPNISGAASLFTDNVAFPAELLDPSNPLNDPHYLQLLCSMLGIKELEKIFGSADQIAEREEDEKQGSSHTS